jgi:hypothetical protein
MIQLQTTSHAHFLDQGFVHLPGFFAPSVAAELRDHLRELSRASTALDLGQLFKWNRPNGVTLDPALHDLLFHAPLLEAIRDALGSNCIAYTEGSDVKVWQHQDSTGWHRDSRQQRFGVGPEWDETVEPYRLVRVALYLQNAGEGFGWGAIPGSHRSEHLLSTAQRHQILGLPPRPGAVPSRLGYLEVINGRLPIRVAPESCTSLVADEVWIRTDAGDVLLFDPRLIHAGGEVPYRKYAIFFSFGVPNGHAHRHSRLPSPRSPAEQAALQDLRRNLQAAGLSPYCPIFGD